MAFTYDLATDAGKLRLMLGDTNSASYTWEDAELAYFLTEGGSVGGAAVLALDSRIAALTAGPSMVVVGGQTIDRAAALQALSAQRDSLARRYRTVRSRMPGPLPSDAGWNPLPSPSLYSSGS